MGLSTEEICKEMGLTTTNCFSAPSSRPDDDLDGRAHMEVSIMKVFWQRTLLILVLMSVSAFAAQQAYKLRVDGLACPFCAYGIEKKLNAIKGVQRVEVDIATGIVTVTMAEGTTLDEAAAKKAVKDAGFSLRGFERAQASTPTK